MRRVSTIDDSDQPPDIRAEDWRRQNEFSKEKPIKTDSHGRYTVKFGDDLDTIAMRELRTEGKHIDKHSIEEESQRLIALNRNSHPSLDKNPDHIEAGWKLQMHGHAHHKGHPKEHPCPPQQDSSNPPYVQPGAPQYGSTYDGTYNNNPPYAPAPPQQYPDDYNRYRYQGYGNSGIPGIGNPTNLIAPILGSIIGGALSRNQYGYGYGNSGYGYGNPGYGDYYQYQNQPNYAYFNPPVTSYPVYHPWHHHRRY
jgi:hypothetical protein